MFAAVKPASSATPLRVLTALSVDTETTSLDIKTGRIIEIGAVPLVDGKIDRAIGVNWLINPHMPIPPESRAVHGISDAMVADAQDFRAAYNDYQDFTASHVVMGYSLGFDLAMFAAECTRTGLPYKAPRGLDVRDLVRIISPQLPDYSLEKVAAWLGVKVTDRHRALGDAIVTAEVFLALLPLLRERGIRTLAEAESACKRASLTAPVPAGWQDVAKARPATAALARVDSYPYRHRVKDVMASPPLFIDADATTAQALHKLVSLKVSSLFVKNTNAQKSLGILTERDLLRAISADPTHALEKPALEIATFPLETVRASDFLYSAFGRMQRKRYRHLGVVDAAGNLVGALTQRDLLRQRADDAIALTDAMDRAAGVEELAVIWRKLADAARALVADDVDPRDVAAIISGEVCSLTARAAEIAERELADTKPKNLNYAVMVLGSGGRGESLLALDQDNAIIYEGEPGDWLEKMATRMNAILDEVGVPFCKGGVMARNSEWRKSSKQWREHVQNWLNHSKPQDILNSDIFFDALPVHGDARLADNLRQDAIEAASQNSNFLKLMAMNAANFAVPLGWFGRFSVEENGRMDLKKGGIMPAFSAARMLALKYVRSEHATAARLEALRGHQFIPQRQLEQVLEAHRIILGVILDQQLLDIERGIPPSNKVDPKDVPPIERDRLKWALEHLSAVRDIMGDVPAS